MITLNATNQTLEAFTASSTSTSPTCLVSYGQFESSATSRYVETISETTTSIGTTAATILAAPSAGYRKVVRGIFLHNADANSITLTIRLNNNSNYVTLFHGVVKSKETVGYDSDGFYTIDFNNGGKKVSTLIAYTGGHNSLTGLSNDDHTQYLLLTPNTGTRNVITAQADITPISIQGTDTQTNNLTSWIAHDNTVLSSVAYNGKFLCNGIDANSQVIEKVASPTLGNHAVNKTYADSKVSGATFQFTGDILVATGNGLYARLGTGISGQALMVTKQAPYGIGWVTITGAGGVSDHSLLTNLGSDTHTQYVALTPGTDSRNVIYPLDDYIPLKIVGADSQTKNLTSWFNSAQIECAYVNANGKIFGSGLSASNLVITDVGTPSSFYDAANKLYSDTKVSGQTYKFTGDILVATGDSLYARIGTGVSGQALVVNKDAVYGIGWANVSHGNLDNLSADDHSQYVSKTPGSDSRNAITPSSDYIPLKINASDSQTKNLTSWYNSAGAEAAFVNYQGKIVAYGLSSNSQNITDVAAPTVSHHAVNKTYADTKVSGESFRFTGDVLVGTGDAKYVRIGTGVSGQALVVNKDATYGIGWANVSHNNLNDLLLDNHTNYLLLNPGSDNRNIIAPSDDYIPLKIVAADNQTKTLTSWYNSIGSEVAYVNADGKFTAYGLSANNQTITDVATPTVSHHGVNKTYADSKVSGESFKASGDIIVGTGNGKYYNLTTGGTGQVLTVSKGGTFGIEWRDPPIPFGIQFTSTTSVGDTHVAGVGNQEVESAYLTIPSGKKWYVLTATTSVTIPNVAGLYEIESIIYETGDGVTTVQYYDTDVINKTAVFSSIGSIASPLAIIPAGKTIGIGWQEIAGPAPLSGVASSCSMYGYLI